MHRVKTGLNQDDLIEEEPAPSDASYEILRELERALQNKQFNNRFKLPVDYHVEEKDRGLHPMHDPSLGLPSDCSVKAKNQFLFLKPQIALRSDIDENAIVLLAVEEIAYGGYAVIDEAALDDVTADVLNR